MFDDLWTLYPRKVAKKAAQKAYDRIVKTVPHSAIVARLEELKATEWRGRDPKYLPHCSTFLNAEAFDVYELTPTLVTNTVTNSETRGHFCTGCRVGHWWQHEHDIWCEGQREMTCPEERMAMKRATSFAVQTSGR